MARDDSSRWAFALFATPMSRSLGSVHACVSSGFGPQLPDGYQVHTVGPPAQGKGYQSRFDFNKSRLCHQSLQSQRYPRIFVVLYALQVALGPHLQRMIWTNLSAPGLGNTQEIEKGH